MIPILLLFTALVMVALPGLIGQPLRLRSAEWARAAALSLFIGLVALELALVLIALPTLFRSLNAAGLASICEHVLAPLTPGGPGLGWVSLGLAAVLAVRVLHGVSLARRVASAAEVEPWLGRHEDRGHFELVVLPTPELLAVSVPGAAPQVVVSEGLVQRLDAQELDVVVRHEAAHLRCKHWRYLLLATAVDRALRPLPLVARSTRTLRDALEAWADEGAVGSSASDRALARRTMVTLAHHGGTTRRLSSGCGLGERARRLAHPPHATSIAVRAIIFAPILMLSLTIMVLLLDTAAGSRHAAALAGYCFD